MRADEPWWWYRPDVTPLARCLIPAGRLWGYLAERRFRTTTPRKSPIPVICIGNFTIGGTGKTPLAILAATILKQHGRSPAFLSRGYGGRVAGPHLVDLQRDDAATVGDEPLLLARQAPVMIARDRAAGAAAIAAQIPKADVLIMDDGMQNPALQKDLTIAVVDGSRGVGNGHVMPAGPLRAPLPPQLGRTDVIVVNRRLHDHSQAGAVISELRRNFKGPVIAATTVPQDETQWLKDAAVVAYAGIGAPERFFNLLSACGANVVVSRHFPDHHPFTNSEAAALLTLAEANSAILVTTEKDWVRLDIAIPAVRQLRDASRTLGIRASFDREEFARLESLLLGAVSRQTNRPQ